MAVLRTALLLAIVLSVYAPPQVHADDLSDLRSDVRNKTPDDDEHKDDHQREKRKRKKRHSHRGHWVDTICFDDDDDDNSFVVFGITAVVTSPWWVPHVAVGDSFELDAWFPPAPYDGVAGALFIDSPLCGDVESWTAHLRGEYANDFGNQNRAGGNLLLEHESRFGIDTSWDYRYQDLPVGHDDLWTGDFNVVYRFAQSEKVQFRSGLGVNWLSDEVDTDLGFNFTYGADFFPAQPWVISAVIDWGRLGEATLFHGRATIGVIFDRFEVYTGYDYYDVGGTQLDGFIAGFGVWLN